MKLNLVCVTVMIEQGDRSIKAVDHLVPDRIFTNTSYHCSGRSSILATIIQQSMHCCHQWLLSPPNLESKLGATSPL